MVTSTQKDKEAGFGVKGEMSHISYLTSQI